MSTTPAVITVIDNSTTRGISLGNNITNIDMVTPQFSALPPSSSSPPSTSSGPVPTDSTISDSDTNVVDGNGSSRTTSSTLSSSLSSVISSSSTTTTATTASSPADLTPPISVSSECPDLNGDISINISITSGSNNNNNKKKDGDDSHAITNRNTNNQNIPKPISSAFKSKAVHLSTSARTVGTVVRAECRVNKGSLSVVYLRCQASGQWNSTLPVCYDKVSNLDVSSYRLYFAIVGGVCGLSLLVLCILYCHLLRARRKKANRSCNALPGEGNIYVDPSHVGERLYTSPHSSHYARTDITYAKPVVYSTYLNPSFYEDAYERWRRQEQSVSERLYDSPWMKPRGIKSQMETTGFRWSQTSLKTLGESGFRKLPRAQLSIDHASIKSNDSIGRRQSMLSRDRLRSVTSVASSDGPMALRRYPLMAAPDLRSESANSKPLPRMSHDHENDSALTELDRDSSDGLTNF